MILRQGDVAVGDAYLVVIPGDKDFLPCVVAARVDEVYSIGFKYSNPELKINGNHQFGRENQRQGTLIKKAELPKFIKRLETLLPTSSETPSQPGVQPISHLPDSKSKDPCDRG